MSNSKTRSPRGSTSIDKTKTLLVGFDTEYTRIAGSNKNLCLSYQFYIQNTYTNENFTHIYYPETNTRLSLQEVIVLIFTVAKISDSEIEGYYINLICHYCNAEWGMLKDRATIAKYFNFMYKTLITPQAKKLNFTHNSKPYQIRFDLSDTKLLLPDSHQSLDKAVSLLDSKYKKLPLSEQEKAHMDVLLHTDPAKFEEYALTDAKITLKLYIKLQELLNHINDTQGVRYTTIGNATVKHFKKFITTHYSQKFFSQQFIKKNGSENNAYNLARRAYLGGLNNSYRIGEVKHPLILDIDFSSAYPTAMNLIRAINFPNVESKTKTSSVINIPNDATAETKNNTTTKTTKTGDNHDRKI